MVDKKKSGDVSTEEKNEIVVVTPQTYSLIQKFGTLLPFLSTGNKKVATELLDRVTEEKNPLTLEIETRTPHTPKPYERQEIDTEILLDLDKLFKKGMEKGSSVSGSSISRVVDLDMFFKKGMEKGSSMNLDRVVEGLDKFFDEKEQQLNDTSTNVRKIIHTLENDQMVLDRAYKTYTEEVDQKHSKIRENNKLIRQGAGNVSELESENASLKEAITRINVERAKISTHMESMSSTMHNMLGFIRMLSRQMQKSSDFFEPYTAEINTKNGMFVLKQGGLIVSAVVGSAFMAVGTGAAVAVPVGIGAAAAGVAIGGGGVAAPAVIAAGGLAVVLIGLTYIANSAMSAAKSFKQYLDSPSKSELAEQRIQKLERKISDLERTIYETTVKKFASYKKEPEKLTEDSAARIIQREMKSHFGKAKKTNPDENLDMGMDGNQPKT